VPRQDGEGAEAAVCDQAGGGMSAIPLLVTQCRALRLPVPVLEHRFHPTRRWRFDAAWLSHKLAVEVDGGGFVQGRHSRGAGMEKDAEKFAEAMLLGWRVIRTTPRQVKSGQAVQWIERALHTEATHVP